jgi:transposase
MKKATRFVGLDVHADTIAVAVAEPGRDGEVRALGVIPNQREALRALIKKLGGPKNLKVCYEAGPTGYALYWQLVELGVECEIVAPTLVPQKPGERVKTDRRDAIKLARCHRAGDLTAVFVPEPALEALRDLVRAREAAKKDEVRARHRLTKLLLRAGRRFAGTKTWSAKYLEWARKQQFEHPAQQTTLVDYLDEVEHHNERVRRLELAIADAVEKAPTTLRAIIEGLQALHGVAKLTATTLAVEIGTFSRFEHPKQLMAWAGCTPREHSTGGPGKHKRGAITKTGNAHVRRVLCEAAWQYQRRPGKTLRKRQRKLPTHINELGEKAQHRLCRRFAALTARGKPSTKAVTAIARELLGFVWAIAVRIEQADNHDDKQENKQLRRAA